MTEENKQEARFPSITYLSLPLLELSADRAFPGPIYLCIQHKMVRYKNKGDQLEADAFNKLIYNRVKFIFIEESDRAAFQGWIASRNADEAVESAESESPDAKPLIDASQDQRRAMMDIF